MSESNNRNGGIGFCGLLTILFVGLKLTGHISWSWWWVLSPLWIPFATVVAILIAITVPFLIALPIAAWLDWRAASRRKK